MSERNGDKARFQKDRKRKILDRMRIREMRKATERNKAATPDSQDQRSVTADSGITVT